MYLTYEGLKQVVDATEQVDDIVLDVIDGLGSVMIADARQYAFCQVDNGNEPRPHISPYYEGLVFGLHEELLWRMDVLGCCFSSDSGLKPNLGEEPEKAKRNPPFSFEGFGIAEGAIIEFYDAKAGVARPEIHAKVCGLRKIRYRGKVTSIAAAAKKVMKLKSNPSDPAYWTYNGRLLADIYREKYPL